MDLEGSSPGKMSFAFSEANEINIAEGMHMRSMDLSLVDADNITQRWTMFQGDSEPIPAQDMHLARVQYRPIVSRPLDRERISWLPIQRPSFTRRFPAGSA